MAIIFGGYESFMFENSIIGSIYPTSPPMDEKTGSNPERAAKHAMMRTVAERGKYHYSYDEYFLFSTLRSICCCFTRKYEDGKKAGCCARRLRRLQRHEEASDKLAEELDIVKLIYV